MAKRYLRDEKSGKVVEVSKEDFDAAQEQLLKARENRRLTEPESKSSTKAPSKAADK